MQTIYANFTNKIPKIDQLERWTSLHIYRAGPPQPTDRKIEKCVEAWLSLKFSSWKFVDVLFGKFIHSNQKVLLEPPIVGKLVSGPSYRTARTNRCWPSASEGPLWTDYELINLPFWTMKMWYLQNFPVTSLVSKVWWPQAKSEVWRPVWDLII